MCAFFLFWKREFCLHVLYVIDSDWQSIAIMRNVVIETFNVRLFINIIICANPEIYNDEYHGIRLDIFFTTRTINAYYDIVLRIILRINLVCNYIKNQSRR